MHLRFGETESAFDYMMATHEYLEQHGKLLAFYSDKHGIFRVNMSISGSRSVARCAHCSFTLMMQRAG
jgi:hypothetical protein